MGKKNISILLVAPQPFMQNRGTPIAVKLLCETLTKIGYEVHLLVYHEGSDISIEGVTIHRIPKLFGIRNISPGFSWKKLICDLFIFLEMKKLTRNLDIDLIHAVEEAVFCACYFKYFHRIPYVYDMDSHLSAQLISKSRFLSVFRLAFEFLERKVINNSLGVLAVCKSLEIKVKELDPSTKTQRLEDYSLIQNTKLSHESLKRKYNIAGGCILYVGNLEKYQGIDLLLESFEKVCIENNSAKLVIIGGSESDIKKYGKVTKNLSLQNRVHLIGPRPIEFLGDYLSQADILISPRILGTNTPMKIYSYLDSGKPIIATAIVTHTQVLTDNVAILVKPDKDAMADGIIRLLNDKVLCKKIGSSGKKLAEDEYSEYAFRRKLSEFYEDISSTIP